MVPHWYSNFRNVLQSIDYVKLKPYCRQKNRVRIVVLVQK
jgi:hypothetical protein